MSKVRQTPVSNPTQAVKPAGSIVAGTTVMTLDGALPVEYLTPGDRIITRSGAKELKAISVQVDRDVTMVRMGTGTLGHDRPIAETLVPLHQMILIRDWRAQALYGAPQAFVAAGRLADGHLVRLEITAEVRVFKLDFDADVVIYAGGLEMACLREAVNV